MKRTIKSFIILSLSICIPPVVACAKTITDHVQFTKTLTLAPGQSPACQAAFQHTTLQGVFSYDYDADTQIGLAYAFVKNPSNSSTLSATLYQLGESDRLAFSHYYNPLHPLKLNKKNRYVYSIMMDICPDSQQIGMQISPETQRPADSCLFTSGEWNYCR